jgi:hypothetical protein
MARARRAAEARCPEGRSRLVIGRRWRRGAFGPARRDHKAREENKRSAHPFGMQHRLLRTGMVDHFEEFPQMTGGDGHQPALVQANARALHASDRPWEAQCARMLCVRGHKPVTNSRSSSRGPRSIERNSANSGRKIGGRGEDRTRDLCIANAALSQLSYAPPLCR